MNSYITYIHCAYCTSPLKQTTVKKQWLHSTEVTFPAVTVCNTNPVKQSMLHLSSEVSALRGGGGRRKRREAGDGSKGDGGSEMIRRKEVVGDEREMWSRYEEEVHNWHNRYRRSKCFAMPCKLQL